MKLTYTPALLKKAERWAIITIALMVGISILATLWSSGASLSQNLANIPIHAVYWLLAATVVQNLLRFARYHLAAQALRLNVPWYRHLYYFVVGFALMPTPGKVGMAIRLWLLKQYHGLPYSRTAPLMVMDLISDALAMLALVALSLVLVPITGLHTIGIIAGTALVVGLVITLAAPKVMLTSVKLGYFLTGKRKPRLFAKLLGMVRTMSRVFGPRIMLATTGLSFLAWGLYGAAVANLIQGFGITTFGIAEGTLAINLSNIGGFLSMMPAGMLGAEAGMATVFKLAAVPFGTIVLAIIIIRVIDVWLPVLLGFCLLPLAIRRAPKDKSLPPKPHQRITTTTIIQTDDVA